MPKLHVTVAPNDYHPPEPKELRLNDEVVFTKNSKADLHIRVSSPKLFSGDSIVFGNATEVTRFVQLELASGISETFVLEVRPNKEPHGEDPPHEHGPGSLSGRGTIVVVGGTEDTKDDEANSA